MKVSDTRKREISIEMVEIMNGDSITDMIAAIDLIEQNDPGDDRQKRFYEACRKMAHMIHEAEY